MFKYGKLKMGIAVLIAMTVISVSAGTFDELTKSFVVLQSSNGKTYLCAAVKMDGVTYVVSSQSLFLNPIPKFRLKTFSGKSLKQAGFEVSRLGDFIRIKVEDNPDLTPLEAAGNANGRKKVYSMNPDTGIIYSSNAGGNLMTKNFKCVAGAPVINNDGKFVGVASRTDNGLGKRIEMKVAAMSNGEKWQKTKAGLCAKQVYSLEKLRVFTKALDHTRDRNKKDGFMEINEHTHPKLKLWMQDQNKKAFDASLASNTRETAMRDHVARCFYYSGLKRLAAFYSSNAQSAKKTRWKSNYLKGMGKAMYDENYASTKKIRATMQSLVQLHPSIKAKF